MNYVHHLGLTVSDLELAEEFYAKRLGQPVIARHPPNYVVRQLGDLSPRVTVNFFEIQLTLILAPVRTRPEIAYNEAHLGIIFCKRSDFDGFRERIEREGIPFFTEAPTRYHVGKLQEQENFFILDPFNNVLQFKYYKNIDLVHHWAVL